MCPLAHEQCLRCRRKGHAEFLHTWSAQSNSHTFKEGSNPRTSRLVRFCRNIRLLGLVTMKLQLVYTIIEVLLVVSLK